MKSYILAGAMALMSLSAWAVDYPDTVLIPERAVTLTGQPAQAAGLIAVLYNREDMHYSDPSAPRFLFLDREGKVALGIGGYVKGTMQYDFGGSSNTGSSLVPYNIPVPGNPAQRSQFFANANRSTVFLSMVGKSDKFGLYQVFVQTNFSGGGNNGYDLKLKQAYVRVGYVTAGLTNSTFVDGAAGTPTIEDQGPEGEMGAKNILLQYKPKLGEHVTLAISAENPDVGITPGQDTEVINQRMPDLPVYIQYAWDGGNSHVRASAIWRNMSYRDMIAKKNRFAAGWGVQLSGLLAFCPQVTLFYQGAYGRGYARYVNDLSDGDLDLIPDAAAPGKLTAPKMMNFEGGVQVNATDKCYLTAAYSEAHLYGQQVLGGDAYKYGRYLSAAAFYDIVPDVTVGLEYNRGSRHNVNRESGSANMVIGMLKISF